MPQQQIHLRFGIIIDVCSLFVLLLHCTVTATPTEYRSASKFIISNIAMMSDEWWWHAINLRSISPKHTTTFNSCNYNSNYNFVVFVFAVVSMNCCSCVYVVGSTELQIVLSWHIIEFWPNGIQSYQNTAVVEKHYVTFVLFCYPPHENYCLYIMKKGVVV